MLRADEIASRCPVADIASIVSAINAPVEVRASVGGRGFFATRDIAEGEVIFSETATAWFLARAPGADGVYVMSDESGKPIVTLPPWAVLRTIRDTLTLSPPYEFDAENAFARLSALSAFGSTDHSAWAQVPKVAPGVSGDNGVDDEIPARVQLVAALAQCNAFSVALPPDSEWKRAILWPTLGRMQVASDRERLFDALGEDSEPFQALNAFFVAGSAFNHSCTPNVGHAECLWEEGTPAPVVTFRARRQIKKGEEAFLAYVDPMDPVSIRRRKLLITYHFSCTCAKCASEDSIPDSPIELGKGANNLLSFFAAGGGYPQENAEDGE
jgi:hypothetical protein